MFFFSQIWEFFPQFPIHKEKVVKEVCLDLIKANCVFTRQCLFLAKDLKSDLAISFNSFGEDVHTIKQFQSVPF